MIEVVQTLVILHNPHRKKSDIVWLGQRGDHFIHSSSAGPALSIQWYSSMALYGFMQTRLCRTCHTVVFSICNSQFPFRTYFLASPLKVVPPAIQPQHSHGDGHCFSSYKCVSGFQSCQTTSALMLEEVDSYETIFWRPTEHWCMNLFSCTQSHKISSVWEASFLKIGEHNGKDR
jgi:hypothetical protein